MACTRTSLPLPLLSDNVSDVSPIAVTSRGRRRRWLQSAEGCHNIKAPKWGGFGNVREKQLPYPEDLNFFPFLNQETPECYPL
jgi:hypothetical protein